MSTSYENKEKIQDAGASCDPGCCGTDPGAKDTYGEALPQVERTFSTPEGMKRKREALWSQGYTETDLEGIPDAMLATTFGSGNPLAIGEIARGETVIDLGSGAGLDAVIAARRTGRDGIVYGVDPSPRMLNRSRSNARDLGLSNIHFLEGGAQKVPLPEGTADVVLSNCVLSCVGTGEQSFREAYRILKPGGRLYVTDVFPEGADSRSDALTPETYRQRLVDAGFASVEVERSRMFLGAVPEEGCCSQDGGQPTLRVKAFKPAG